MKRTFFILIALVVLMVAAAIGLVSSYNGIELHGLFIAAVLLALGVSLLFPKPVEHWFRLWFHPSHKGEIGNTTPISHKDPLQPQPRVLLTRKAFQPWVYAVWAAAPVTFVILLIYSTTDLPGQWGFHFTAWVKTGPLRFPVLACGLSKFILARITYKIPFGNPDRKMLPEVLVYYPRNLWETGWTSLALLHAAMTLSVIYLGQLLIFVEIVNILSNPHPCNQGQRRMKLL